MYAVIRAGGKQYRVAPGDVIRVEKLAGARDSVEFGGGDVLAVSASVGSVGRPQGEAKVIGQVIGDVKGDKILVFHYKRKKQYKKLQGHRQPYTELRITEIAFDGQSFKAPEKPAVAARAPKAAEAGAAPEEAAVPKKKAAAKKSASGHAAEKGSKAAAHHGGSAKSKGSKSKGGKPKK